MAGLAVGVWLAVCLGPKHTTDRAQRPQTETEGLHRLFSNKTWKRRTNWKELWHFWLQKTKQPSTYLFSCLHKYSDTDVVVESTRRRAPNCWSAGLVQVTLHPVTHKDYGELCASTQKSIKAPCAVSISTSWRVFATTLASKKTQHTPHTHNKTPNHYFGQ